jgi:lia operon protein LiaF
MHSFVWGLVIIAVGAIFLLNHLGVITMGIGEFFSIYWPGFIILFGVQGLLLQSRGMFWWNPFVILIGFLFLGRNLNWFDWDISDMMQLIWPIILILFGVSMIFRGGRRSRRAKLQDEQWNSVTPQPTPMGPPPAPPIDDEPFERRETPPPPDWHTANNFSEAKRQWKDNHRRHHDWRNTHEQHRSYGHGKKDFHSNKNSHSRFIGDIYFGHEYWELSPMSISNFIGDTTLDLTKAQVPIGETRINVSSFIGDVKVYVPNDLRIGIKVMSSCLIGDVKVLDQTRDGFFNQMSVETPSYTDAEQRVILVVSSFIGDVRVMKVG